jgi:hypothetical protein
MITANLEAKNGYNYFWIFTSQTAASEQIFKEILQTVQFTK